MWALCLALAFVVRQPSDYEEALRDAQTLVERGLVDEAASVLEGQIASRRERPEAYLLLGLLERRRWRPGEAIDIFARGIEATDGVDADMAREIAVTYAELRLWDGALDYVKESLSEAPSGSATLMTKAMILTQKGDRGDALQIYESLLADDPQNADLHFRIGEHHESVQRLDDAEAAYRRALAIDSSLRGARFRLGALLLARGKPRPAERELTRALALAPDHAATHLELARALEAVDRTVKARHHYERAIELDPELAGGYLALGNFAVQNGDGERGRALLETFQELTARGQRTSDLFGAVEYAPDDEGARDDLLRFLLDTEQYPLAVRTVQRLLLEGGPNERLFLSLARAFEGLEQPGEAERTLRRALSLYPESDALRSELESRPREYR